MRTQADPRLYRWPLLFIALAFFVPIPFLLIDWRRNCHELFSRSGAVSLLFNAIAQYQLLSRLQSKNMANDRRVASGGKPWPLSSIYHCVEIAVLIAGVYGTLIWGYGDLLIERYLLNLP